MISFVRKKFVQNTVRTVEYFREEVVVCKEKSPYCYYVINPCGWLQVT